MGKSELTNRIEKDFLKSIVYTLGKNYACQEVSVTHQKACDTRLVDILRYNRVDNEFICYEIKISKSDFESRNGHNFVGDKNYYIVPEEMIEFVKEKLKFNRQVGLIEYKQNGKNGVFNIRKRCVSKPSQIDYGTSSILMFNLMKALQRECNKYRRDE